MLTKKRQHFFFYTEKEQLFSFYMYNFESYKQLFLYGDWYAGSLTNYINVRQNLINARSFSSVLLVNNNFSNFALYQPKAHIFLDKPHDSSALHEFQKVKSLYFENPTVSVYKNSYHYLTNSTFSFFFNLYFIFFQLKKKRINKNFRLHKKLKIRKGIKLKLLLRKKAVRTSFFFYT